MCSTTVSLLATVLYGAFQLCVCVRVCISLCARAHVYADGCPGYLHVNVEARVQPVFSQTASFFKLLLLLLLSFFVCMCVYRGQNMTFDFSQLELKAFVNQITPIFIVV